MLILTNRYVCVLLMVHIDLLYLPSVHRCFGGFCFGCWLTMLPYSIWIIIMIRLQGDVILYLLLFSGGARILEQAGPAAGPTVVWEGLKLFRLTTSN